MKYEISKMSEHFQTLSKPLDKDGNGELEGAELGSLFALDEVKKLDNKTLFQELGVDLSTNPIKASEPSKVNRKEQENDVKKQVKELVKTLTPEQLIPALKNKFTNTGYPEIIAEVEKLLNAVNATNYNSKEDVEKIKDKVKKNPEFKDMTGFQKDILDSLVKQAKDEQIVKEATELYGMYTDAKAKAPEADKNNVEKLLKQVKEQIKDKKSYYNKEAFNELKNVLRKEIQTSEEMKEALRGTTGHNRKAVQKELLAGVSKGDKFTSKIIKKYMKSDEEIAGRHNTFEDRRGELASVTENEIRKELGDELFRKLNAKYLTNRKNPDGTYNLSDLSDIVLNRVGYNYTADHSTDTEMSEKHNLEVDLESDDLIGQDLSKDEVKKIIEFTRAKVGPTRTRNVGKALGIDGLITGIAGAAGGLLASGKLSVTQKVSFKLNASVGQDMFDQLTAAGMKPEMSKDSAGMVTIKILQQVLKDKTALNIIAGFGIGYLQGAAMSLLIGEGIAFEKSCISINDFNVKDGRYTDIKEFEKYIKARYPEKKADTIMLVAQTFVEDVKDEAGNVVEQKFDLLGFQSKLNEIAGVGSDLNCEEMTGASIYHKGEQPVKTNDDDGEEDDHPELCNATVKDESTPETDGEPVDTTCTLENPARYYWDEIADAYYPGLRKEHPNDWSRILKKGLAYDKDGNFDQKLYKDLLAGKPVKTLDLPDEIAGYQRRSCEDSKEQLDAFRANRNGKARRGDTGARRSSIDRAGRRSSITTKIPRTNQWRATDGCTGESVIGASKDDAVAKLKEKTGKEYGNIINE